MSIVISQDLSLAPSPIETSAGGIPLTLNNPIVGYDNLVTAANVTADFEDVDFPALNLGNPSTYLRWESSHTALEPQYVTIINSDRVDDLDYVGIAGHNFGSDNISVQIEGASEVESSGTFDWRELSAEIMPADDSPLLFRFTPQSLIGVRIRLVPNEGVAPRMAVVYVGKLLILERRLYVSHRPITLNTRSNVVTGFSEQGQFLGRLVLGEFQETQLDLPNLTPDFVRQQLNPFRRAAIQRPFFLGWRPDSYSSEVGYCWATANMTVSNSLANGLMTASLPVQGITE